MVNGGFEFHCGPTSGRVPAKMEKRRARASYGCAVREAGGRGWATRKKAEEGTVPAGIKSFAACSESLPVPKACLSRKSFGNSKVLTVCGANILGNLQPRREAMKFVGDMQEMFPEIFAAPGTAFA